VAENRRLSAILAVDVVGYSRLMGEDEEGTLHAVQAHREAARPLVSQRGGRVVKTMGDGLLLEFPSVVAATECAIAIQALMAERNADVPEDNRIVYRIGVHIGDVIVADEDIYGDGVNIAVRLDTVCEPGGVCLSEDAHRQVSGKVGATFVDLGVKTLKNIARPLRVFGFSPPASAQSASGGEAEDSARPRLSIVVLPFANLSGGPEQDYFVDGVVESLTTDLSRINGAFVIDPHTAFTYKGKAADLRQIGRDLNVRYALEGSVQRGRSSVRVNVQLVETATRAHLWAERFDKPVADLFAMQDEIVARLANRLGQALIGAEARRASRTKNPDSMDAYFMGHAALNSGYHPELMDAAIAHFDRALTLDPENVDALVFRAYALIGKTSQYAGDLQQQLLAAETDLNRALALRPESGVGHAAAGWLFSIQGRTDDAISACERALALDRNNASAHAWIAAAKFYAGRHGEVEAHILDALRLSPSDVIAPGWAAYAAAAKLHMGADEDAVAWARRSIEADANNPISHLLRAAALGNLGRLADARKAVQAALALNPKHTIASIRAAVPSDKPAYLASRERFYAGLRLAGLPEE